MLYTYIEIYDSVLNDAQMIDIVVSLEDDLAFVKVPLFKTVENSMKSPRFNVLEKGEAIQGLREPVLYFIVVRNH